MAGTESRDHPSRSGWIDKVLVEAGSPLAREAYNRILHTGEIVAAAIHLSAIPVFWFLGRPGLVALNVGFALAHWGLWFFLAKGWSKTVEVSSQVLILTSASINTVVLGWESGFQYYIFQLLPLVLLGFERPLWFKAGFSFLILALLLGIYTWTRFHGVASPLPEAWQTFLQGANLVLVTTILAVLSASNAKGLASVAILLRETNQMLETIAYFDPLTGLPNRRALWDRLRAEVSRTNRHPPPPGFVVVLADVDDFKAFNDTWGHDLGDQVLAHVASVLRDNLRGEDVAGRWGGEEFLFILPETLPDAALQTLERLRSALKEQPAVHDGRSHAVTMTFGFSAWKPGELPELTISRADAALLSGKRAGKNRVVSAS